MFSFLKNKLKKAVDAFSKKTEEEADIKEATQEEIAQAPKEEKPAVEIEEKQQETTQKKKPTTQTHSIKKQTKEQQEKKVVHKKTEEKPLTKKQPEPSQKEPVKKEQEQEQKTEQKVKEKKEQTTAQEPTTKEQPKPVQETTQEGTVKEEPIEEATKEQTQAPSQEDPQEKKSFFGKLTDKFTKVQLSEEKFDDLFWDLELAMLENNVAVEVIEKIKADLRTTLTQGAVTRRGVDDLIHQSLKKSIEELFIEPFDLIKKVETKKPYVIAFIGINGSGKTTTLAKVANLFQTNKLSVVMAASDTFRAAAIDQLQAHANTLGIKLISQGYGADPAAVAYDAIEHAKAKSHDVVMIDTAGRLHSNNNLMAELEKVIRVAKPDLKIFIGESITGNDCVEQAQEFDKRVGIDAIILSKADVDEKGGAALSVSYVTKKPILYLGVGQAYGDLEAFDKERIMRSLGL